MNIDKQKIVDLLRNQGDQQKAQKAEQDLPQQVDTDNGEHQNLLEQLGIDPMDIAKKLMGGKGIPGF